MLGGCVAGVLDAAKHRQHAPGAPGTPLDRAAICVSDAPCQQPKQRRAWPLPEARQQIGAAETSISLPAGRASAGSSRSQPLRTDRQASVSFPADQAASASRCA